eukprot:GEZU01035638.1.p1 GENE.GEZU01035638.1~~GEZU01035638.1.p1  ORF type:complete len:262 (-),score=65.56 GEZU01035638.1:94-879(-)
MSRRAVILFLVAFAVLIMASIVVAAAATTPARPRVHSVHHQQRPRRVVVHSDPPMPVFPPSANTYQVNITYVPSFFYPQQTRTPYSGFFHANVAENKYAVVSRDPVRTFETVLFRADQKDTYVISKFGEFPASCKQYSQSGASAAAEWELPSFAIPVGFDQDFFKSNAQFAGTQVMSNGNKVDVYEIPNVQLANGGAKNATFYFESGTASDRNILQIVEYAIAKDGEVQQRTTFFNAPFDTTTSQPDSLFALPRGVSCTPQ